MCECDDVPAHGRHGRRHLHRRHFLQAAGAGAAMLIGQPGRQPDRHRRAQTTTAAPTAVKTHGARSRSPRRDRCSARRSTSPRRSSSPAPAWGADETLRTADRTFAPIQKLIVHHSATPLSADPTADIRNIYKFHIEGRDWADIAYNFVIDQNGRIYEGRWARDYADGEVHYRRVARRPRRRRRAHAELQHRQLRHRPARRLHQDAAERRVADRRDARARVEGGPEGHRRVGRRSVHELLGTDVGVPEHHRAPRPRRHRVPGQRTSTRRLASVREPACRHARSAA